jgi:hypothetical protein
VIAKEVLLPRQAEEPTPEAEALAAKDSEASQSEQAAATV